MNRFLGSSHPSFCLLTELPPVGSRLDGRLLPFGFVTTIPSFCPVDLSATKIWDLEVVDEMLLGPHFGSCSRLDGRLQFPEWAADLLLLASASQSLANIVVGKSTHAAKHFVVSVIESEVK